MRRFRRNVMVGLAVLAGVLCLGFTYSRIITITQGWTAFPGTGWTAADSLSSIDNTSLIDFRDGTNGIKVVLLDNSTGTATLDLFLFAAPTDNVSEHLQYSFTADNVTCGGLRGPDGGAWKVDLCGLRYGKFKLSALTAVANDNITGKWLGY